VVGVDHDPIHSTAAISGTMLLPSLLTRTRLDEVRDQVEAIGATYQSTSRLRAKAAELVQHARTGCRKLAEAAAQGRGLMSRRGGLKRGFIPARLARRRQIRRRSARDQDGAGVKRRPGANAWIVFRVAESSCQPGRL